MSQAEAGAIVETIMLEVYQPVPAAWFKLSRLRSAKRETRVKWLLGMMTRYTNADITVFVPDIPDKIFL